MAVMSQDRTPTESVTMESVPNIARDDKSWHYAFGSWRECNLPIYDASCEGEGVISSLEPLDSIHGGIEETIAGE